MSTDINSLKNKGNEHFQRGEYSQAIKFYTSVIEQDPSHVIALGNRSASYLALSKFDEAQVDARRAIELDRTYIKGYFRLASALKSKNLFNEAVEVSTKGLVLDPENAALKKLKEICKASLSKTTTTPPQFNKGLFGKLYNDKNVSGSVSEESKYSSSKSGSKSGGTSGQVKDSTDTPIRELTAVEKNMHSSLQNLINRITNGDFGFEDANNHMLQGTFKQLVEKNTFIDLLFPGVPNETLRTLPQNLTQLLQWNPVGILVSQSMMKMTQKSASILEGVRTRGASRGDILDATTESVLIPQIAQETFAREIVEIVKNLSKRASSLNARVNLSIASPDAEQALLDQLDLECIGPLIRGDGIAVQDSFLGDDWSTLVYDDLKRYLESEKMTEMRYNSHIITTSTTASDGSAGGKGAADTSSDKVRMAWIEHSDISNFYPALAVAIQNLHGLPYEINAISNTSLRLLEPGRGFTMLVYFPVGASQPPRFDNHLGENDSGLRLSCAYHLVNPESVSSNGEIILNSSPTAQYVLTYNNNTTTADIIDDRLIIYDSLNVKNERTPASRDYFVIYFYIHGQLS